MGTATNQIGVGIVGAGFMGQTYARTVSTLVDGVRLAGVAEGSRAPALADEYDVPCFASCEELVSSD
ncbi:MAG: Gfo/Idh/MocA family oxidoreductase, partial [bacterium]|nr:Gfo/Idh/MocA family oxidoreductase [bacterium]